MFPHRIEPHRTLKRLLFLLALLLSIARADAQRPRLAVGGFFAESNAFYPAASEMTAAPEPASREAWLQANAVGGSPTAGIIEAGAKLGLDLYPVVSAGASFLGAVSTTSFNKHLDELIRQLKTADPKFDGIFLVLHGAMVVEDYRQGDAEVAKRVRAAMGPRFPIVVTNDFHANVAPELVENCDVLITFKDYPHVDRKERGIQAATIMAQIVAGKVRPVQALVKPPLLFNLVHQNTFTGLMKPIVEECRRLERENPKILAVSFPGGYQWADVKWMGPSAIVVTDNDPELAKREAQRLSDMLWAQRDKFVFNPPDTAKGVKMAMESDQFPVILMDTGDNIGGGSAGDGTYFLAEFLRRKTKGWTMSMLDTEAVKAATKAGVGGRFDFRVGGKRDKLHGEPVRIAGVVRSLRDEPPGGGRPAAVIEVDGSTREDRNLLLLTSRSSGGRDVAEYVGNGIDPKKQKIVVSKGTIAPYDTFRHVAARIILVNTPGPTDVNPVHFNYRHVRRPIYGLD